MTTDNVIHVDFAARETGRSAAGDFICRACGHEWIAVCPIEDYKNAECPNCKSHKGHPKYKFKPEAVVWVCECGCDQYFVTQESVFCPNCANEWPFDEMLE